MNRLAQLAVFISGSGSNLQAIIDRCQDGTIPAKVALVVSSSPDAYGLIRAEKAGIDRVVHRRKDFSDGAAADQQLLNLLQSHRIDLIAFAGYLKMVSPVIISRFRGRVVNIHPGILPRYGGKGMYGLHVHEAVIANKERETGVTVHLVDEVYDHGQILACQKVPVRPDDTPETLAARVLEVEHALYPAVISDLCDKILKGSLQ